MTEETPQQPETKPKAKRKRYGDWALLALAAFLFWVGGKYDYAPQEANHKYIVATEKLSKPEFKGTVVFVIQHLHRSAAGFILNRPDKSGDYYDGGPLEKDRFYLLHSLDTRAPETLVLDDVNLGFIEGKEAIDKFLSGKNAPKWHRLFKGDISWGPRQLEREISDSKWEIVDFDQKLFDNPDNKIWDKAKRLPLIKRTY